MPQTYRPHGLSARDQQRLYEQARGSASERLYDARWSRASKLHLGQHPLCVYCALGSRTSAAVLVDHFYPHRGDAVLFWRSEFWVSSCTACHSGMKQSVERQGMAALRALAARLGLPAL